MPFVFVFSAASMSSILARHHDRVLNLKPALTIVFILTISSCPIAGVPISSSGTPALSSNSAIRSFSFKLNTTPGACSPSRSVESIICMCRFIFKS